jgi:hypothetical protein
MPSKTFQPLLFDSFKYKLPNSTYADHYTFKKRNNSVANTKKSTQREKMTLLMKRSRPFTTNSVYKQNISPVKEEKVIFEKKQSVRINSFVILILLVSLLLCFFNFQTYNFKIFFLKRSISIHMFQ